MPYSDLEKKRLQAQAWRRANPDKCRSYKKRWQRKRRKTYVDGKRRAWLRRLYGITPEVFDAILVAQGGVCGLCKRLPVSASARGPWNVDHDHETGFIRGVLCNRCNLMLGLVADDPSQLRNMAEYLHSPPALAVVGRQQVPEAPNALS